MMRIERRPKPQGEVSIRPSVASGANMSDCNAYRQKAMECLAAVETMHDPVERAELLAIAHAFIKLADRVAARDEYGGFHRNADRQRRYLDS
jgi:hypothetical protein